jgi:membrane protein implicated in regulation of membrane protease activity
MVLFLLVIIVAVALGIIGAVAKGLLYVLFVGAVLLVADLVYLGWRRRRSGRRPQR